ncbi:ABC transporter substrate-binding protein [Actinocorallia longicatena]|uniref:ABC transporter substrate-binding protein n=1 Tax=Actinocorallia longicatena TaxID=111803 RepID=A0ABP6Q9Y8_9ACTN
MKKTKPIALAAAGLLLTSVLAACGGGDDDTSTGGGGGGGSTAQNDALTKVVNASDKKGGTLRIALSDDFDSLDPGDTYAALQWNFSRLYARALVTFKPVPGTGNLELVPDLATDLGKPSDDGLSWTYTLRPGLKYDDGTPITSKDVKYAVERSNYSKQLQTGPKYFKQYLADPDKYKGPYDDKADFKSIETPDDSTVVFKLSKKFAEFDYLASMPQTAPVPKAKDKGLDYKKAVVSSGPYKIDAYAVGKSLSMSRNPSWDQASDPIRTALPDKIEVQLGQDANDIDNRLLSGGLDLDLAGVGVQVPAQGKILGNTDQKKLSDVSTGGTLSYLALNQTVAPLDNIHCRKAVAYATDKLAAQTAFGGPVTGGQIATTIVPSTVSGYVKADAYPSGPDNHGDVAKAKEELAACGKPNGFDIVMSARSDRPKEMQMQAGLQQGFARVGIKVTFKNAPFSDYITTLHASPDYIHKNKIGIIFTKWGADWPSGFGFLSQIVDSRAIKPSGNSNYQETKNPEVDKLLDQAAETPDKAAREKLYAQIDQTVMAEAGIVPLVYSSQLLYRPASLTNVYVSPAYSGMYDYVHLGVK